MDVVTLRRAMQPTVVSDATLTAYLPHFIEAMKAAEINTVRRAAAWNSQLGHESAGLKYMAEIQTSGPGWSDDRRIYRGRGPIQLTWSSNYRKFGQWCQQQGYVDHPEIFVENPEWVEEPRWGFLASSWYWLNAGPRPGQINGFADQGDILAVSRCVNGWVEGKQPNGMPDRTARWSNCLAIGDELLTGVTVPELRADFQEYPKWSMNHSSRNGAKVDLFLLHTQEGGGGDAAADDLAKFLGNPANEVSYHYTVSTASDGGTTVVDVVDTDEASWSVLSANARSINLCFAGSKASWSRDQWLQQAHAIDVAAYIAVQDCQKYGIPIVVNPPPYKQQVGISDHQFVTKILKDGTHTDVGPNFPWDVFTAAVNKYANNQPAQPEPPKPVNIPEDLSDRYLLSEVWDQLRGPDGLGWPQLGGRSLVDAVGELLRRTEKDTP